MSELGDWWLHPIAFEKAILWSMLFEGLGLGCGSGPLTGRYAPPLGGALYFARPGTTKRALWPTLAAVVQGGADPALLDTWAEERRAIFLERTSPQACAYKDFVFHACGGGERLEAALEGMRRMVADPDYRLQRLMFTKGLETTSPAER